MASERTAAGGDRARAWGLGALVVAGMAAGCSGKAAPVGPTYAVEGRVLLPNGQPLSAGRVAFVPADEAASPAVGEIGADGTFTLATKEAGDGAVPGQYRVRIEPPPAPDRRRPNRPPFPLKYIDEDTSGLVVTVRAEANRLDPIRLK